MVDVEMTNIESPFDSKAKMPFKLRVGSRESQLARIQTEVVTNELRRLHGDQIEMQLILKKTTGDHILDQALHKIGEKSLFTKELEWGLANCELDLVVHSLKDLPTTLPEDMCIVAVLERADPRDCVVLRRNNEDNKVDSLHSLGPGSVVGTSSVRRRAQISANFPDLRVIDIRGNLNTRIRKLDQKERTYHALLLAKAGVMRMGWGHRVSQVLDGDLCLHAVGQGSLAIECRKDDEKVFELVSSLGHRASTIEAVAERCLMHELNGGCSSPVAAHAQLEGNELWLEAGVWSLDGSRSIRSRQSIFINDDRHVGKMDRSEFVGVAATAVVSGSELSLAEDLGRQVAYDLLSRGADAILVDINAQKMQC